MNPTPTGYTSPFVHIGSPQLSDKALTRLVRHTWTCAECLHVERDDNPGRLREKARAHAREHEYTTAADRYGPETC
jgi:hypothetical protein